MNQPNEILDARKEQEESEEIQESDKREVKVKIQETSQATSAKTKEIIGPTFTVETYSSEEITEELTKAISDLFRLTFNNTFPEFLACIKCELQMPAWQVFGSNPVKEIDLKTMDDLDPPPCFGCGEQMELFHGKAKTEQKLTEKFRKDAQLTVLKDQQGDIQGFTFGYKRRLRDIFQNEWGNKFGYMDQVPDKGERDFQTFLKSIGERMEKKQDPDQEAYCWNCVVTTPKVRGKGHLAALMSHHAEAIPEDFTNDLLIFGETIKGTKFHHVLQKTDLKEVDGYLNDGYILTIGKLKTLVDVFKLPKEQFKSRK